MEEGKQGVWRLETQETQYGEGMGCPTVQDTKPGEQGLRWWDQLVTVIKKYILLK